MPRVLRSQTHALEKTAAERSRSNRFDKIPGEIRLEIFSHITGWSNFLAFRHTDAYNFSLSSRPSLIESKAFIYRGWHYQECFFTSSTAILPTTPEYQATLLSMYKEIGEMLHRNPRILQNQLVRDYLHQSMQKAFTNGISSRNRHSKTVIHKPNNKSVFDPEICGSHQIMSINWTHAIVRARIDSLFDPIDTHASFLTDAEVLDTFKSKKMLDLFVETDISRLRLAFLSSISDLHDMRKAVEQSRVYEFKRRWGEMPNVPVETLVRRIEIACGTLHVLCDYLTVCYKNRKAFGDGWSKFLFSELWWIYLKVSEGEELCRNTVDYFDPEGEKQIQKTVVDFVNMVVFWHKMHPVFEKILGSRYKEAKFTN